MILVTGAGGKTGRAVIAALAARGETVRAFVRREALAEVVLTAGALDVAVGALDNVSAMTEAMHNARAIYHICPNVSPQEFVYGGVAVEAAKRAGVGRFIYHSVLRPHIAAMPHHWEKARVEELLFASGLKVTMLQPAAYMQNLLAGWVSVVSEGVLRAPYPVATQLSLVDLKDVAEVAAMVLTQPGHEQAVYELVGTPGLTQAEVATVLGQALGRDVRAIEQPLDEWQERAQSSGLNEHARETLGKMFAYYGAHGLVGSPNVLRWLLGRAPTTLAAFAAKAAGN